MKNETARREIESLDYYLQNHTNDYSEESHTAMMMAIQALERQQSDDCISRQEAISAIQDEYYAHAVGIDIVDIIAHLPPVQPTRPTGKWIDIGDEGLVFKCSLCGNKNTIESKYCPNCGARMQEEEA